MVRSSRLVLTLSWGRPPHLRELMLLPPVRLAASDCHRGGALRACAMLFAVVKAAVATGHCVYVPVGALWGAADIEKMALGGSLRGVTVKMVSRY